MRQDGRQELEARWLHLTRVLLPALAAERGWPVCADHCFHRIILDHLCGGVWYHHVHGRPAYRVIDDERLRTAVAMATAFAGGHDDLVAANNRSLGWRRCHKA